MSDLLTSHGLTVEIGGKTVCRDLHLQVHPGHCWAVLGMNGVGKTTLLHTLAGLRPPRSGRITLQGEDISRLTKRTIARTMGLLLQDYEDAFPGTVLQTVLSGRHPHMKNWQWESAKDMDIARQALAFVELESFADRSILTLSGGERRRAALATLLCQQPRLYLLDEPTNHLDLRYQHQLLERLTRQLGRQNQAAVMIMHDVNLAMRYCDHALLLFEDGKALAGRCDEVISAENLSTLYDYPMRQLQEKDKTVFIPG